MRINEAYEHETIRPYQGAAEEEVSCPLNGCNKVGTQCVSVSEPVVLAPTATVGSPTISCQGSPSITCTANADKTLCIVTMTQEVCVSIPVCYGVTVSTGDPTITCADNCAGGCGC